MRETKSDTSSTALQTSRLHISFQEEAVAEPMGLLRASLPRQHLCAFRAPAPDAACSVSSTASQPQAALQADYQQWTTGNSAVGTQHPHRWACHSQQI